MTSNNLRGVIAALDRIVSLEEHLRAGTAPRENGWGTASAGQRADQRDRLRAQRRRLQRQLQAIPPRSLTELHRLLEHDRALSVEFLELQLLAALHQSDRIAVPGLPPEQWGEADPDDPAALSPRRGGA